MPISLPTDISNCSLWLQAEQSAYTDAGSTLATNGQTVQQWNDLSGNSRHASQGTSGSRPSYVTGVLNNKPVIRFGAKSMVTPSFFDSTYDTALTVFVVCKSTTTALQVAFGSTSSNLYVGQDQYTPTNYTNNLTPNRGRTVLGANTPNAWRVQTLRYSGSNRTDRMNGVGRVKSTTGNLGLSGTATIGAFTGGSFGWTGDIAEIIVYKAALTDQQILDVESFLNTRYALTTQTAPQVLFDGDSITLGYLVTTPWPTRAMTSITARWTNLGVNGHTVTDLNTDRPDQIETAYTDGTQNIICVFAGTNDMYFGASAATTLTRLQTYHAAVRALGYKTIQFTVLPRSGGATPGGFEAARQTLNTSIRANSGGWYDALCDVAADSRIGDSGDETNTTFYQGDTTHPNDTGMQVIADLAIPVILSQIDSTAPVISTAAINTAGTSLVLTYTETGTPPMLPATGVTGYTLSSSTGVAVTVSSGTISSTTVTLTLSRQIYNNETITYSYSQGTGNVTDTSGNEIAAQTNAAVTNGSTVSPSITSVSTDTVALVGTASTITWSSAGIIGNVDILLSLDGGSTFPITIASNTANDGTESWTPTSGQLTATGVIRVRSSSNNSYQGTRNVKVATTSGGVGGSTGLWFRLQELAVNDGLELQRP